MLTNMERETRLFVFFVGLTLIAVVAGQVARAFNGRPYNGFIQSPPRRSGVEYPEEKFYEFQYVNHFDGADFRYWKQRYFVNDTFQLGKDGPIFLVLGGEAELDPIWAVEGAWIQYAQRYGAGLVLLEHRYYGKSQPVPDLSTPNLQYLSSRQALEDTAQFINYYKEWNHISESAKWIVFGASYSGSLAAWFKSKYPYLVDGAVASSAPLVADMEFAEYLVDVSRAMEQTGPGCVSEVREATNLIYEWWGQPDKRILMQQIFKLCTKIDHSSLRDWPVMYYKLAENFASVIQYNHDNRAYLGASDVKITTERICDIMRDETRGNSVQRYADVSNLLLEARKETCLDIRYSSLVGSLNYTELDNDTAHNGARQWLYQTCAEFGWFQTTISNKQPFGSIWAIQFNLTTDQCIDLFQIDYHKGIFGGEEVDDNCAATNRYYGGRSLSIKNALFVDHEMDPWRNVTAIQRLPNSVNTQIIHVKGTAHVADIYSPSENDPAELVQARELISQTIGKWLAEKN